MKLFQYIIMISLMTICSISHAVTIDYQINEDIGAMLITKYNRSINQEDISRILTLFKDNALRTGTNPNTILGIAINESRLNHKAIGPGKYSQGIMQVNTRYHKSRFVKSPLDLEDNIRVGVDILKECQTKASSNLERTINCYRGLVDKPYLSRIQKFKEFQVFVQVTGE